MRHLRAFSDQRGSTGTDAKHLGQGLPWVDAGGLHQVIDYIAENSEDREVSVRLLGPSLRKLQYARAEGLDWRALVKTQLQTLGRKQLATKRLDTRMLDVRVLRDAIAKYPDSVQDQQTYWCERTAKSRASFYRTLNRYREEIEE